MSLNGRFLVRQYKATVSEWIGTDLRITKRRIQLEMDRKITKALHGVHGNLKSLLPHIAPDTEESRLRILPVAIHNIKD